MYPLTVRNHASLYWAERQQDEGGLSCWRVSAVECDMTLSLCADQMASCSASGQWVVAEMSTGRGGSQLGKLRLLPASIPRLQLERQFHWVGEQEKGVLIKIWSMLAYIDDVKLQRFLLDVLLDDQIMLAFCRDRASHGYHHNHVGGLLAHSYEVAVSAATLCSQHRLGMRATWVAFIGGLLHDIGKIRMFYNDSNGVAGQHETYSFMVLSGPLERLRMQSTQLFEAVTACLALSVSRWSDPYQVADIVRMCDRLSSEVCNWKKAFERQPNHYWYAKSQQDGRLYKRLN